MAELLEALLYTAALQALTSTKKYEWVGYDDGRTRLPKQRQHTEQWVALYHYTNWYYCQWFGEGCPCHFPDGTRLA